MSNSWRSRRHHTTEQKVTLLKRRPVDKVPVSDLCNEEDLQPSLFYTWQRQLYVAHNLERASRETSRDRACLNGRCDGPSPCLRYRKAHDVEPTPG
jgi:transposase-like protein